MSSLASTYAEALLHAADKQAALPSLSQELHDAEAVISTQPAYFYSPIVAAGAQIIMIRDLFTGQAQPLIVEFLCLLAQRRLLKALPAIRQEFSHRVQHLLGNAVVTLRVLYPPDPALLAEIEAYLLCHGFFGDNRQAHVQFRIVIDSSIVGGFVAQYECRIIDASFKTQLKKARL